MKSTGLESLTDKELVALIRETSHNPFLIGTYSLFVEKDFFGNSNRYYSLDGKNKDYFEVIRAHLIGKRVVELGAGANVREHRRVLKELFGVRKYIGVDLAAYEGCIESDALLFLGGQNKDSSICLAFGFLNEPIFGKAFGPQSPELTRIRDEYTRRLAKEIYRVTIPEGIFFGNGIDVRMGNHLERAGFENYRIKQLPPH